MDATIYYICMYDGDAGMTSLTDNFFFLLFYCSPDIWFVLEVTDVCPPPPMERGALRT